MDLTAAEARVLGCLIERAALDPDSYPVTLNTLRLACNQSEGRDPVVAYDDRTVEDTLLALKSKGLARFVDPLRGERATRYSHRADDRWRLGPAELAVLSVLLVGGEMTLVDVEGRARRLHPFGHRDEIVAVLDTLAARTPTPFAARLGGGAGAAGMRWAQALVPPSPEAADEDDETEPRPVGQRAATPTVVAEPTLVPSYSELAARVAELERRLAVASQRPARLSGSDWRPVHTVPIAEANDDRNGPSRQPRGEAIGPGERDRSLPAGDPPGADRSSLAALTERLVAVERRLARVEAELGALR